MAISLRLSFSLKEIFQTKALFPEINLIDFTKWKTNEIVEDSHFVQNVL